LHQYYLDCIICGTAWWCHLLLVLKHVAYPRWIDVVPIHL
jgi:hypothetical protein